MLPYDLLTRWRLVDPKPVADTATSTIWKVTQSDGRPVALKLLRPGEIEEARGADYMAALGGQGTVRVLARDGDAILMEWCDGPSLGDLVRDGQDARATEILCDTVQHLHAASVDPARLQSLAIRFAPLTAKPQTGDLATAADLARALLASTQRACALHGDLHHDNILQGARGWLAIDPKGVWGDPAYEPANAFRNPDGAGDLVFRPDRIAHLADRFAHHLHQPRARLLGWAAAHCALSTFWSREAGQDPAADHRLLPVLLSAAAAAD
ncbi:MAG: phosphotransferase [Tabrizicola sp.]|jgi:streptomycin 6-kinase|nr:phosphotransferase [Tabrizicola sp.]